MKHIRYLALAGPALVFSGCSFAMFTTSHEHREASQALEHRVSTLEQRMSSIEQAHPVIAPTEVSPSAVTVPAGGIQPTGFEESTLPVGERQKKGSPSRRQKRESDPLDSTSLDADFSGSSETE